MARESQLVEKIARALAAPLDSGQGALAATSRIRLAARSRASRHRRRRRHPFARRPRRLGPHLRRISRKRPFPREHSPARLRRLQVFRARLQRPRRDGRHPAFLSLTLALPTVPREPAISQGAHSQSGEKSASSIGRTFVKQGLVGRGFTTQKFRTNRGFSP